MTDINGNLMLIAQIVGADEYDYLLGHFSNETDVIGDFLVSEYSPGPFTYIYYLLSSYEIKTLLR